MILSFLSKNNSNSNHRIIFIFIIIFSLQGYCQELKFNHFTTIDGLPNNEVRKIIKDSLGFLWFGTPKGLSRYDGYRFVTLDHGNGLIENRIFSLVASKKNIWVGTVSGLSVISTESMQVLDTNELSQIIGNGIIGSLFVDSENRVWLSNENQNFIINSETFETREILKDFQVVCISKALNNTYWVGTNKGLLLYNATKDIIIKTYNTPNFNIYSNDAIYVDSYGVVWLTIKNGIYTYESSRDRIVKLKDFKKSSNAISEESDGSILFGSYGNGLLRYNRKSGYFENFSADPTISHSISSNEVYDVFADINGIVWVGTQEGLDYYDFSRNRFKSLVNLPNNENSLESNFVQSIYGEGRHTIWVGMRDGVDTIVFDENKKNPIFKHINGKGEYFELLRNSYVMSILKDSKNRLWLGTMYNGLFVYSKDKKNLKRFVTSDTSTNAISSNSIRYIFEDFKGRIWFATNNGISKLRENEKGIDGFDNINEIKKQSKVLNIENAYKIIIDSKERIWIGMHEGGVTMIIESPEIDFFTFKNNPIDETSLSDNDALVLFEDSKNRIWIGTSGNGLNLLMEDGDGLKNKPFYFKRYTEENGLANNQINSILEDDANNLWVATNDGLSRINLDTDKITNYATYDGVLKGKFRPNSAFKSEGSTLFFGGSAGINYFQPANFSTNINTPNPIFTNLFIDEKPITINDKIDNQIIITKNLSTGSIITLPNNKNRFSLEFSALSFTSPIRNQYKYKLEGIDKDWQYLTGDNPHVNYSDLPWGNYRFYLTASNNDGIWNNKPIYVDIHVKFSFYTTKTNKIISILLFSLILFFGLLIFKRRKKIFELYKARKILRNKKKTIDPQIDLENKNKVEILNDIMIKDQLYLNPNLNLKELSNKLEISQNHLSLLLNDYIGQNFYNYVNFYRIEEVKQRLANSKYVYQTLSSIGLDCGFNSKSAFNRIFKKATGKTPSEYKNSI